MRMYYVYQYTRTDGTPYYIGKGTGFRAYSKRTYRPLDKKRIQILVKDLSEQEAFLLEKKLIKKYGRQDIGTGTLKNKTDGGEGGSKSPATRKKLSIANKGKQPWNKGLTATSDKRVLQNALSKRGKTPKVNPLVPRRKISLEQRKRMSKGQLGKIYPTRPCEICGIAMKTNAMSSHLRIHTRKEGV